MLQYFFFIYFMKISSRLSTTKALLCYRGSKATEEGSTWSLEPLPTSPWHLYQGITTSYSSKEHKPSLRK